jgi:diguanylate cyclase (GGDEF)-like protein/PAS domain S-box-containing protein
LFSGRLFFFALNKKPNMNAIYNDKTDREIGKGMNTASNEEDELHQVNAYNRSLIETSLDPLVTISQDGKITDVNAATEAVTGWSRDALIGTEFVNYFSDPIAARAGYQEVFRTGWVRDYALEIRHRDGHVTPVLYNAAVYRDEIGKVVGVFAAARDITEQKRAQAALRDSERHFRAYFEHPLVGMASISPDNRWLEVNDRLCDMLGYSRDELMQKTWLELTHPDDLDRDLAKCHRLLAGEIENYTIDKRYIRKDGQAIYTRRSTNCVRNVGGAVDYVVVLLEDVSEQHLARAKLQELADHDPLTHLPNRRLLEDRLRQAIAHNLRTNRMIAICYLDLDGFKLVNDQLGHEFGDQLLVEVASRLLSMVRVGDTVARIGGDEFVLLLSELASLEECEQILARLLGVIAAPYHNGDTWQLEISASIGVTLFPQDAADADTLLRQADQAMYTAKQTGRNRYHFFDLPLELRMASTRETLGRIRQGLANGEFCLYFQPQVDFGSKAVIGAEALIRWQHPIDGLLEPAEFLPAVENNDLALAMGDWVIREALRQMQIWRREGVDLLVSINTFARQLRKPDFVASLQQMLSEYPDVPPSQLRIEITETAALPELPVVQQIITDCQQLGVGFSIDDFGTGYCSLIYLRHLSATELKIDKSFVLDMLINHEDKAIVESIIALGCAFQRSVIAEGVETSEQMHRLLELGCKAMQGYGIARPMPSEQIVTWVRDFQPANILS